MVKTKINWLNAIFINKCIYVTGQFMIQGNQIIEELRLYIHNEITFALDYTMITLHDVSPSFSFDRYDNFDKVVFPISIIF